jgi:hypothetical protein
MLAAERAFSSPPGPSIPGAAPTVELVLSTPMQVTPNKTKNMASGLANLKELTNSIKRTPDIRCLKKLIEITPLLTSVSSHLQTDAHCNPPDWSLRKDDTSAASI